MKNNTDLKTLLDLISISSLSGEEQGILEYLEVYFKKFKNLKVFSQEENLIVEILGKDSKKNLLFNGHVDTVSLGEKSTWNHNPFGEVSEDGTKVYGVGASDMKASIFSFLKLIEYYSENKPPCNLIFSFVVMEEFDGSGSEMFVKWLANSPIREILGCVIGEPTGLKFIENGHKGNYFLKVTTFGDSGHGSRPKDINSHAVLNMFKLFTAFEDINKDWEVLYRNSDFGIPSIGIATSIQAGDSSIPNTFPGKCTSTIDVRTNNEIHPKLLEFLKNEVNKIDPFAVVKLVSSPGPVGFTNPKDKFIKTFQKIRSVKSTIASGSSDLCFFTNANIPTFIYGPGEIESIHKPDEFCYVKKIYQYISDLKSFIKEINTVKL